MNTEDLGSIWRSISRKQEHLRYGRVFHKILEDAVNSKLPLCDMKSHPMLDALSAQYREKFFSSIDLLLSDIWFVNLISNYDLKCEVEIGSLFGNSGVITSSTFDQTNEFQSEVVLADKNKERNPALENSLLSANVELGVRIGRIDLLAISNDRVVIVDYKSDAYPSLEYDCINRFYIEQINFYRSVISSLYPSCSIESRILWLSTGQTVIIYSKLS